MFFYIFCDIFFCLLLIIYKKRSAMTKDFLLEIINIIDKIIKLIPAHITIIHRNKFT